MNNITVATSLDGMTKDELLALNKRICERIREINSFEKARAIRGIVVGDKMFFIHKGQRVNCIVEKVLRTNVDVTADPWPWNVKWRVAANLLQFRD